MVYIIVNGFKNNGFQYLRSMTDATLVAERLLQIGAVQLRPNEPFTWASGWKSPIYCDNRKILSHPFVRDFIKSELCNVVFDKFSYAEVVAGVATAGIPWGAMIADQLKLPFIYVRAKAKEHGMGNQIEGEVVSGKRVVVIEDLISTGKSSLQVVDVLKQNGFLVDGLVAIFNYGFRVAEESFDSEGVNCFSLTNFPSLIKLGSQKGLFPPTQQEILLKWKEDPSHWSGVS